jgi:glucose-6-phosphate-specific signal transduction histidine kinase
MLLSGQLLLVASRPILPSQGEGTSQGTLIMGRFLNAEERQRLNRLTDLSLTVQLLNNNQALPDEFAKARTLLLNKRMVVQTLNENTIAGYVLIKDVYQQPVALLRIELPREIYQEGLASLRYLSAVVLIVALAFAGLILWLFERLVLARLAVLSNEVRHIRTSDDFLTVTVKGQDELAHLATTINNMLSALQASHTRLRQSEAETLRLLEENRFLIYHSMEIQEDERRYLARELHDEFGQCITAIQADAEAIAELAQESSTTDNVTAKIKISADAILTVSAHIYDVVHTLMRQLRPSGLDELGLVEILQEMVRTWQARHPETRCTLTTQGKLDQLGETVNITLYRVMQECLTNVAKYANASQVTITLEANSVTQQLILKVQDNGQGMSLTKPRRGLGLIGIRERTQALEGHLQLESSEGQGMKITLTIPIAEEYQQKRRKRQ